MKWPFNRNKNIDGVPAEIQEYYQTERRERTGVAWLLALGTLLVTVGLATLLFFGGRWLYRTVANRDGNRADETAQVDQSPQESTPEQGSPATDDQAAAPPNENGTSSTSTTDDSDTQGVQTTPPAAGGENRTTTPVTGDGLPDTGPGDIVSLFAATTVAAAAGHYAITSRRTES
jgi:cytoskeletal protein RodZ